MSGIILIATRNSNDFSGLEAIYPGISALILSPVILISYFIGRKKQMKTSMLVRIAFFVNIPVCLSFILRFTR